MQPWKPEIRNIPIPGDIPAGVVDSATALRYLTPEERQLRERFADEYIRDYNQVLAALRVGFSGVSAYEHAAQLMEEPIVQRLIRERQTAFDPTKEITLGRVTSGLLQEATREGVGSSHAARVAAWMGIAKVTGVGEANKTEVDVHLGGVMVVPATPDITQWAAQAVASQTALKADVAN